MVRLEFSIRLNYNIFDSSSDFIFNVHAAKTARQCVVSETLHINQALSPVIYTSPTYGTRYMRLKAANGSLLIRYDAVVNIEHFVASPGNLTEVPISELPHEALAYIYPSRYCQSDRLHKFASREFGNLPHGYGRVLAIQDWVRQHVAFKTGASNGSTSALDTIIERAGVCRDFAHLMIALCRAVNIPARFVSGIDYGADPALGPTDFHAYVEVMLSNRWYLFDPSDVSPPMGLVRIGTGRDAADVAFATVFGAVNTFAPVVDIVAVEDVANGLTLPQHCADALSTHGDLLAA
jgi:transglutaminase-like putative cysteine protease